jgi:hypothetical protein
MRSKDLEILVKLASDCELDGDERHPHGLDFMVSGCFVAEYSNDFPVCNRRREGSHPSPLWRAVRDTNGVIRNRKPLRPRRCCMRVSLTIGLGAPEYTDRLEENGRQTRFSIPQGPRAYCLRFSGV